MKEGTEMTKDLYFGSIDDKFREVLESKAWRNLENDFKECQTIMFCSNGGNFSIASHIATDISRLTDKVALTSETIMAMSLINDKTYCDWMDDWVTIMTRQFSTRQLSKTLLIGISSSGRSQNVLQALKSHHERGIRTALITSLDTEDDTPFIDNQVTLGVEAYHTGEVLTLLLGYQLIKSGGYECPLIREKVGQELFHKKYIK